MFSSIHSYQAEDDILQEVPLVNALQLSALSRPMELICDIVSNEQVNNVDVLSSKVSWQPNLTFENQHAKNWEAYHVTLSIDSEDFPESREIDAGLMYLPAPSQVATMLHHILVIDPCHRVIKYCKRFAALAVWEEPWGLIRFETPGVATNLHLGRIGSLYSKLVAAQIIKHNALLENQGG